MFNAIQKKTEEKQAKEEQAAHEAHVKGVEARMKVVKDAAMEVIALLKTKEALSLQEAQFVIQTCEQTLKSHMGQLKLVDVVKE